MKYRLIASALVVAVLAVLAVATDNTPRSTPAVSAPGADDNLMKSFKIE